MKIRRAEQSDLKELLAVEEEAFGQKEGPEIVKLINNLLNDPSACPLLSLVALEGEKITGHILFTSARLTPESDLNIQLLAPLAVLPEEQNRGTGGRLIDKGLQILSQKGVKLVFVLGHPDYYPRFSFKEAGRLGFEAPYPIPDEVASAWMVHELSPNTIGKLTGRVICADAINRPEYWRE
ncbi:MAG: GNAT family N-acetyltransferase [Bacillota bacterium]